MKRFIDFSAVTVEDIHVWARCRAGRHVYLACLQSWQDAEDLFYSPRFHIATDPETEAELDALALERPPEMQCMHCNTPESAARHRPCSPGYHHGFVTRRPGEMLDALASSTDTASTHADREFCNPLDYPACKQRSNP